MDSHSPGIVVSSWTSSASSAASSTTCGQTSPSSSLASAYTLDSLSSGPHGVDFRTSPQFSIPEPKRSFSACALSLSNSSDADLSSGYFERRPYRPFRSNEEYLVAMREDLAEWLNTLYAGLELNADNFLAQLETGVILCRHANSVLTKVRDWRDRGRPSPFKQFRLEELEIARDVVFRSSAVAGTFQSRDNVANFINWCRRIRIHECLLFETEDLVMRKNEKSFVLCLLEVARYGAKFGVLAPTLVQFEQEIDRELAKEERENCADRGDCENESVDSGVATPEQRTESLYGDDDDDDEEDREEPELQLPYGPQPQITNNDLESLHEKVVKLLSRCTCPVQFHLEHLSEGKYRIGDTKTLIFVRILRHHVMVRVGGGWDTLEHYLEKHDPCRCGRPMAHRSPGVHPMTAPILSSTARGSTPAGRSISSAHVINDRHENNQNFGHSPNVGIAAVTQSSPRRSVNSSPVPARRTPAPASGGCDSLSSSPSDAASSLASSQNSLSSNSTLPDRNNNSIKSKQTSKSTVGNCKRRVESRIPKFGKPPTGLQSALQSKTKSTSSLALGTTSTNTNPTSRIPSLSSVAHRSSTHNLSYNKSERPIDRSIPRRNSSHTSVANQSLGARKPPQSTNSVLSSRQKQRSTIELRTPTPPASPQHPAYSTSSLHRRNISNVNRRTMTTPPPPVKPPSPIGSTHRRNLSAGNRTSAIPSPTPARREISHRTPSVSTVPVELSRIGRRGSAASSLGDTTPSSTPSSSLSSLITAVPKADFRKSITRSPTPHSKPLTNPKGTVLVDVSSWLERNQLTLS